MEALKIVSKVRMWSQIQPLLLFSVLLFIMLCLLASFFFPAIPIILCNFLFITSKLP